MGAPGLPEAELRRRTEAVEQALRDGFTPLGVTGGRGSAVEEAGHRLNVSTGTIHRHIKRGFMCPDWSLYRAPQAPLVVSVPKSPTARVVPDKPRIRVAATGPRPSGNRRVLVISDLHAPYQHPDALRFLAALKAKYEFDRIINIGDELDFHAMSFHESDPDLDSAGRELQKGREVLWELEALFPRMDLVDSNHGSMSYRRAKAGGVPRHLVLDYRDAIFGEKDEGGSVVRRGGRGSGWRWHDELLIDLPDGNKCLLVHGRSVSTRRNVEQAGMCFVQGHHHSTHEVIYHGTSDALIWGMTIGCLIERSSLAFAYARNSIRRAVIGCGAILDGQPKLLPMVLAQGGRWTGFTP